MTGVGKSNFRVKQQDTYKEEHTAGVTLVLGILTVAFGLRWGIEQVDEMSEGGKTAKAGSRVAPVSRSPTPRTINNVLMQFGLLVVDVGMTTVLVLDVDDRH